GGTTPVLTVFLAYLVISDAILIKLMGPDPSQSKARQSSYRNARRNEQGFEQWQIMRRAKNITPNFNEHALSSDG
ncbi:hypothetical protein ACLBWS_09785, partial [Brucellaceae bacterium D45D]